MIRCLLKEVPGLGVSHAAGLSSSTGTSLSCRLRSEVNSRCVRRLLPPLPGSWGSRGGVRWGEEEESAVSVESGSSQEGAFVASSRSRSIMGEALKWVDSVPSATSTTGLPTMRRLLVLL